MNEDFITFELAKKLKEKGYPQVEKNALAMYNEDGEWYSLSPTLDDFYYAFNDFDENDCVCPTISQVLKWLREEKKIYVYPNYLPSSDKWICLIYDINEPRMYSVIDCVGFTESELLGIEYVVDNLI